jgi:hypothetical protein
MHGGKVTHAVVVAVPAGPVALLGKGCGAGYQTDNDN